MDESKSLFWQRAKVIFKIWFWTVTTTAFMLFILEESSQLLGFSRFTLLGIKTEEGYRRTLEACKRDKAFNSFNRAVCKATWVVNPISSSVFGRYFDQELVKIEREIWRCQEELKKAEGKVTKAQAAKESGFVYQTSNGKCYHTARCEHIQKARLIRRLTLDEAVQKGLRPCRTCNPGS